VVSVGETTPRPSQVGNLQLPERIDYVIANAIGVGNVTVISHIETPIDTPAQVFCKMPVDVFVYYGRLLVYAYFNICTFGLRPCHLQCGTKRGQYYKNSFVTFHRHNF
jgi:hypothetical protein